MIQISKRKLDEFLLTKEQTYWFNKGWEQAHKKFDLPQTSMEIYWKKQREILEMKMWDIIKLLPKGYDYYKRAIKITSNSKYFDFVFKQKDLLENPKRSRE